MRKRRILSLLLAVAVTVTMLVAVPLTASAATTNFKVEDKAYSAGQSIVSSSEITAEFSGAVSKSGGSAPAVTKNSESTSQTKYPYYVPLRGTDENTATKDYVILKITPKKDGKLSVYLLATQPISKNNFNIYYKDTTANGANVTTTLDNPSSAGEKTIEIENAIANHTYAFWQNNTGNFGFVGFDFVTEDVPIVQTKSLSISGADTLYIQQTANLTATQDEGANEEIKWEVEEGGENFVDIDPVTGAVTGKAAGTATIKATATTSNTTATHDITVNKRDAVTELTLDREKADVYVGKDINLTASIKPESMQQYYKVEWSAEGTGEPKGEATVSDGKVTGKKAGEVTITAKVTDDEEKPHEATCTVTVKDIPKLDGGVSFTDESNMKEKLVAAKETNTYNLLKDAEAKGYTTDQVALEKESPYEAKHLYYNNEIGIAGSAGNQYNNKSSVDIDQTTPHENGIRLKQSQDEFALKLAPGSTVRVYVKGGGSTERYGTIGTKTGITDQNASEVLAKTGNLANYAEGLMAHTNKTGAEEVVYVSATSDSYISQIQIVVAPKFGDGIADSGYYTVDPDKNEGAIRFLQSFSDNTAVKKFGFLIINGGTGEFEPSITADTATEVASDDTAKIGQIASAGGFYADVTGITYESSDKYYAKAFVVIDDGTETGYTVISEATIKGEVNWERPIEKPESANQ